MTHEKTSDELYEQNQKLGYQINYLNDENTFYRISINNFKKLNYNINKQISGAKGKSLHRIDNGILDPRVISQSYTSISNKIHLKNLQMKVGANKRRVDKLEKYYHGSIINITKNSEELQKQINLLSRELEYYNIQHELLNNINMADFFISKCFSSQNSLKLNSKLRVDQNIKRSKTSTPQSMVFDRTAFNEQIQSKNTLKLEHLVKQEKEIKKQHSKLLQKIAILRQQRQKLAQQVYGKCLNIRQAQAVEVNKLTVYTVKQSQLLDQIAVQDELLQQQYAINQQFKQKIMDRNQQQSKELKVLQEEIKKCADQVRQIKLKLQHLETMKNKKNQKIK